MVEMYQSSKIADQIKNNNRAYLSGKNRLGIVQVTDQSGKVIFSTGKQQKSGEKGITCIRTPVKIYDDTWYIENYVKSRLLTEEFWQLSMILLTVMVVLFLLIAYYSRYFVRSIVEPIEEVNVGLRKVEDGKLDVHIETNGQLSTDIVNTSKATLPETGGIGTTIFYTVGGLLVIGAIIMLIQKRRMAE